MIPKIIHYIWIGESKLPPLYEECISTWPNFLHDYEIVCWDENRIKEIFNNYDLSFYEKMLKSKKYAFAVDYIRCLILDAFGGIYLDADIEMVKDLSLLNNSGNYLGMESRNKLSCGILAFEKNHWFISKLREKVVAGDGLVEIPKLASLVLLDKYPLFEFNSNELIVLDDLTIYPKEYFYPYNPYDIESKVKQLMFKDITVNTYCIHHWAKSWNYSISDIIIRNIKKFFK